MKSRDARKLSPKVQEEIRLQAIVLYKRRLTRLWISDHLEFHRNTVGKWIAHYQKTGLESLASQKRGPKHAKLLQLNAAQQSLICEAITDRCPDQLKLSFALWTREAVGWSL